MSVDLEDRLEKVQSILVTQLTTKNNRTPYDKLEEKFGLNIDYRPFTEVKPVSSKEFRKQKIALEEFTAIILTSKSAVDHFFRLCDEMRYKVPTDLKYFCKSEAVALYLQKHIVYRKRKVFFGKRVLDDLKPSLLKHKSKDKFLLPCSNFGGRNFASFLEENEFDFKESIMYLAASSDISDLEDVFYDILVFFSPLSLQSLYDNFPEFQQKETRIAAFGNSTAQAVLDRGLTLDIKAPAPESPSMTMAIEKYIRKVLKAAPTRK
ncbi:MAG: uroporphyrinogen-III synthase HemD, putative [uncultured Aureispira sp.]|uniref:Uroporphyrinogen-III synthase HemD, putative n=1 Tax=uncultured Aureispira sp. TaxID=1331704 RepID=A0A6S6SSN0_9BACT|nr:MAG: uroporphyrinogen-III synthase HemD, putative [uncultured Aureispira sp.]